MTIRTVSGFSQSSMQMKTAAIKMVSCTTTYSARKKASCTLEAAEGIIIFVQVSQHMSASRTARGRVGVPGKEMLNGSGTGGGGNPQRTQYSVMQKIKKAKAQVLANTMASGTPVIGLSLLVTRKPHEKEPGTWQLSSTSARFRSSATDRMSKGERRSRMLSPCVRLFGKMKCL